MDIDEKLSRNTYKVYKVSHIIVDKEKCNVCSDKPCTYCCPTGTYSWEKNDLVVSFEGCVECGTCEIVCPYKKIRLTYPPLGHGIIYRYG
ncbi:MAG: 4Fe-4S dicluster domain-containing protein [Nitrososphaerales archaeon]